jgi:hypothetical protein
MGYSGVVVLRVLGRSLPHLWPSRKPSAESDSRLFTQAQTIPQAPSNAQGVLVFGNFTCFLREHFLGSQFFTNEII